MIEGVNYLGITISIIDGFMIIVFLISGIYILKLHFYNKEKKSTKYDSIIKELITYENYGFLKWTFSNMDEKDEVIKKYKGIIKKMLILLFVFFISRILILIWGATQGLSPFL